MIPKRRPALIGAIIKAIFFATALVVSFASTVTAKGSRSIEELTFLAERGDAASQYELGKKLIEGGDVQESPDEGLRWIAKSAQQDHGLAQALLGTAYYYGGAVRKNDEEAAKWFKKAADNNIKEAQYIMGIMYYNGTGLRKDYAEAFRYFTLAHSQYYDKAYTALGVMYEEGIYVEKNEEKAAELYSKAHDTNAMLLLGGMYEDGRGVEQSFNKAMDYYKRASDQGNASAQWLLGTMWQSGKGVGANQGRALSWFNRSCKSGFSQACNDASEFRRKFSTGASPVPDVRQAALDLFGSGFFESADQKYRIRHDELTRFWIEEDFELNGKLYHSKFFASQTINSHTGEPHNSHATGAKISAITYERMPADHWRIVSQQQNIGTLGSWGDISSNIYEAEVFSSSSYGILFDAGYSTQGESSDGKIVYVFTGTKWHDAGYIVEGENNESSYSCGSMGRCHDFYGVSRIIMGQNKAFPDIHVERYGIGYEGKIPPNDIVYEYNGDKYVEKGEPVESINALVSSSAAPADDYPDIEEMHRLLEQSIPIANNRFAGANIDNVTRIKSIHYERSIPAVIYTYYENPIVTGFFEQISGVPDSAIEAARKEFVHKVCNSEYTAMMLLFDLKVIHDFEGLVRHTIRYKDCEDYKVQDASR